MNVVVLCGGVGAARFLLGINVLIERGDNLNVTAIVNTGDDDEFYGQYVCPDIDSILYHLAGINDDVRGWGRVNETFTFVETLRTLEVNAWFNLGDQDLALNSLRTTALQKGTSLRDVTRDLASRLGITNIDIVPMCEEQVTTTITTKENQTLRMQEYFVREKCQPSIMEISYEGAPSLCHDDARAALENADRIIIAPSNPYLSIFPLFAIDEIDSFVRKNKQQVIAISPIIRGDSVKGPLGKIMRDLNVDVTPTGIAEIYSDYISTLILDISDEQYCSEINELGIATVRANTLMDSVTSRTNLARCSIQSGRSA